MQDQQMIKTEHKTLSPDRRDLMLRVMDGDKDIAGAMHILHGYKYCDTFLSWLISHGYTGKHFRELLICGFNSNVPALVNWLVGVMNKPGASDAKTRYRNSLI